MSARILCIDFGEKRIGLAISDPLGILARPLEVIERKRSKEDYYTLLAVVEEHDVEKIVIGLPLNMDGSEGFMVRAMRAFSAELQKICKIEIIEFDERLTSHQAGRALASASPKGKKKRKTKIDAVSAQIILQTYLDSLPK